MNKGCLDYEKFDIGFITGRYLKFTYNICKNCHIYEFNVKLDR